VADLTEEIVFVSHRLAILHTSAAKDVWENRLTELVRRDAEASVDKLRWRRSRYGGRLWVKPLALDSQVRATRAKAMVRRTAADQTRGNDPSLSSLIVVRGAMGADPLGMMTDMMSAISSQLGIELARGANEISLRPRQWRELVDGAGQCTRAARVLLETIEQIRKLKTLLDLSVIDIYGHVQQIELHNSFIMPGIPPAPTSATSPYTAVTLDAPPVPQDAEQAGNGSGSVSIQAAQLLPEPPGLATQQM
jgi:hypothetical protein